MEIKIDRRVSQRKRLMVWYMIVWRSKAAEWTALCCYRFIWRCPYKVTAACQSGRWMHIQRKNASWFFSHSSVKSSAFLVSNTSKSKAENVTLKKKDQELRSPDFRKPEICNDHLYRFDTLTIKGTSLNKNEYKCFEIHLILFFRSFFNIPLELW